MPTNGIWNITTQRNSPEFCVMERAIKMRWAILFELSRRTVIDHAVDTMI